MNCAPTEISGCFVLRPPAHHDHRGSLIKPFQASSFEREGLRTDFVEQFYSTSTRNVLRGMHFQQPPHDHAKLVYCVAGIIQDVFVDVRIDSPTFGRCFGLELAQGGAAVYLAPGMAHGFLTLSETAIVVYNVTAEYAPAHDTGVRWDSISYPWNVTDPIVSTRDQNFPTLEEMRTAAR